MHLYRLPCQIHNRFFYQEWNDGRQIFVTDHVMIMHLFPSHSCNENWLKRLIFCELLLQRIRIFRAVLYCSNR